MPAVADLSLGVERDARGVPRRLSLARRAWLPDVASVAALVTFLYVLFFFQGYTRLFHDSDAGWHIRSGEEMLRTGRLPVRDPYSFSRAGAPWMNWEWLSDVVSGAVHRSAGLAGVAMLFAAAIALVVWCWFRLHWQMGSNFLVACALAVPLLGTMQLHWLARPHVFSWVLMVAAVWWAEGPRSRGRLVLYAAGAAVWANVHGSFFFAPALALLYGVCRVVRPWIWKLDRDPEWEAERYYFTAAGLAALATLANPYGWRLHQHVLGYLADSELLSHIGEYQSFNFHAAGSWQILLALGLAAGGTAAALTGRRLDHFLLGAALLALALRSARGLPLVAILLLPIAGGHLSRLWNEPGESLRPGLRRWLAAAWRYGEELRHIDRSAAGALWTLPIALGLCAAAASFLGARAGFPAAEYPVAAAGELERVAPEVFGPGGRLFAPDKFGGYLIYRFEGRLTVFFDGRSDFYGREFLRDYRQLVQVRPGWRDIAAQFGFTHALVPNDYPLAGALEKAGWRVLYRDSAAILLKAN